MDPALQQHLSGAGDDEIEALVKLRNPDDVPDGLRVVTRFGSIATTRMRRADIRRIWADPRTLSVKAARLLDFADGRRSAGATRTIGHPGEDRRPEGLAETGRGTVVAVMDWGCDFACRAFRRDDGGTRLLALWDQRGAAADPAARRYGYGRVLDRSRIDAALADSRPYAALDYHPGEADPLADGSHGTHVLDIAAGNGRHGGPAGLASEADLVFVHLSAGTLGGLADLGDSVRILEAIDFCGRIAGNRPLVINGSLGRHGGAHRGESLLEQGIDAFLRDRSGRACVLSTGNYFGSGTHAAGRIVPGQSRSLIWQIFPSDRTGNEMEIWYPNRDRYRVTLINPVGTHFHATIGQNVTITADGEEVGRVYHRAFDPNVPDHHIDIFLHRGAPSGLWTVILTGEVVVDGRFDAWVERDAAAPGAQSRFAPPDRIQSGTTGSICNGFLSIAVGAVDTRSHPVMPTSFSSSGPTRDGRQKPDIVAPGMAIAAARSTPAGSEIPACSITTKSGASQAAPHVAGAIALCFEAAGRPLTIHETRRIVLSTASPLDPDMHDRRRVGAGLLQISAAVETARNHRRANRRSQSPHPWKETEMSRTAPKEDHGAHETLLAAEQWQGGEPENVGTPDATAHIAFSEIAEELGGFPDRNTMVAARLFDAFLAEDSAYDDRFAVVAMPGERIDEAMMPGDVVVRRALAEGNIASYSVVGESDSAYADAANINSRMVLRPFGFGESGAAVAGPMESEDGESDAETPVTVAISLASLGVAIFGQVAPRVFSGHFSATASDANYIHQNTPAGLRRYDRTVVFGMKAWHPRYGIGYQKFYFTLEFTYNGVDVLNATIRPNRGASSTLVSSDFNVQFTPQSVSPEREPVAEIVFNIRGRWDPIGSGDEEFSGRLYVKANGATRLSVNADRWVSLTTYRGKYLYRTGGPFVTVRPASSGESTEDIIDFDETAFAGGLDEAGLVSRWVDSLAPETIEDIRRGYVRVRIGPGGRQGRRHRRTAPRYGRGGNVPAPRTRRVRVRRLGREMRQVFGPRARIIVRQQ